MTDWVKKAGKAKIREKAQAILDAVDEALWKDNPRFNAEYRAASAALLEALNQTQNGQGMISAADLHLIAMEMEKTMTDHIVDANKMVPPPHLLKKFSEQARVDSKRRGHSGYCKTFAKLCIDWALLCIDWALNSQPSAALAEPPTLKEQAQAELDRLIALIPTEGAMAMAEPIRKALEALPND